MIKMFEDFSKGYEIVNADVFRDKKSVEIPKYELDRIREVADELGFSFSLYGDDKFISLVKLGGKFKYDFMYNMGYGKPTKSHTAEVRSKAEYSISRDDDEYYYVIYAYSPNPQKYDSIYFKCDQLEGLIKLIRWALNRPIYKEEGV